MFIARPPSPPSRVQIDVESLRSISIKSIPADDESSSVVSSSNVSFSNSTSTGLSGLTGINKQYDDESVTLAIQESKDLTKLRFILITVLFWSTVGVALAIWIYFTENQDVEFEEQYEEDSVKIFRALEETFRITLGAVDSFVVALCAQFASHEWPFVTVPNFSARATKLRKFSNAAVVTNYYYVPEEQIAEWENYSAAHDVWVREGIEKQQQEVKIFRRDAIMSMYNERDESFDAETNSSFMPRWQQSPVVPDVSPYNWDGFRDKALASAFEIFKGGSQVVMSYVENIPTPEDPGLNVTRNNEFIGAFIGNDTAFHAEPYGNIFYPILKSHSEEIVQEDGGAGGTDAGSSANGDVAGIVSVTFFWRDLLKNVLPEKSDGMSLVISNDCNQTFTYTWFDSEPVYVGNGDLHEAAFDHLEESFSLADIGKNDMYTGLPLSSKGCQYTIRTYPSSDMKAIFQSSTASPSTFTGIAVTIFIFTSMVFVFYDCLVERRQKKVYSSAVKNTAIVSSLFPKNVRDRLYKENTTDQNRSQPPAKISMQTLMHKNKDHIDEPATNADAPIADLFVNCTVLFADISGFTSWSSERSPSQVFVLLETIYGAFDRIADRRGVFKVETIGDCYVAVTGLPNPQKDHAVIMAKFARDCRDQMSALTRSLEISLGPDTSDLTMRFGLHSGQVTAGVLRGQKSRFQLFGDTVNTAARMESTGIRNRIQISEETARELTEAGKEQWLTRRDEAVQAKGKGELSTYWIFEKNCSSVVGSTGSSLELENSDSIANAEIKQSMRGRRRRLIDWNVDLFAGSIRKIVARQGANKDDFIEKPKHIKLGDEITINLSDDGMPFDEVVEIIELPAFDPKAANTQDPHSIHLSKDVMAQLRTYIFMVSNTYKDNPFHNFEHASHVTMSVAKLLSRIVAPDLETSSIDDNTSSTLHDHTYGITSDPLTQFACILAALIHDVDHQGVPNTTLIQEEDAIAHRYQGRSVAEQNSVHIAWDLFLEPQFGLLRKTVCPTDNELNRLRQLVVNTVLATDIMDKDLKKLRNERWEKAFSPELKDDEKHQDQINRKATIVLEHLIQASDVSHTMQHWHVYRKWNERLFEEMYRAYKTGRAKTDPSTFWYEGELGFFDHYIIPLSKKLSDCGVFGVSSDEYLNYALRNRKEWEQRGEAILLEMVERLGAKGV